MSYIGNTNITQGFIPAIDYFSGNGSTTAFTLSRPVASVAQVEAVIDNVVQNPSSAYTVSGSTITFTSAPLSGTNNIYVRYTSPITQIIAPSQGTVNSTSLASSTGSGAVVLATSPTLVTPALGTPSALVLTNATALPKAALPTGSVLQVVSSYTTTTTTTTSATPVDSALSATITPTSSSSKILVLMSSNGQTARVGSVPNGDMYFYIVRGATQLTSSRLGINFGVNTWNDFFPAQNSFTYLDSPATTSATTYKMQISVSSGSLTVPTASFATITLMEIAA